MKMIRHAIKYIREVFVAPYRLFHISHELKQVSEQLRRLSQIVGRLETTTTGDKPIRKNCALMTVLIMRENVAFLDEWISHHLSLGVDHVFLYDNSRSTTDNIMGIEVFGGASTAESRNKHGVDYAKMLGVRGSLDYVAAELETLRLRYKDRLTIIPWAKTNDKGEVGYFQREAIAAFALQFRDEYRYCLHIDCDEFLISDRGWTVTDVIQDIEERGISSGLLGQRRFLYRFASLDTPVREIPWCLHYDAGSADYSAGKTLFRLDLFCGFGEPFIVHYIPTLCGSGRIRWQDMRFHHYGWPGFRQRRSLKELDDSELQFLNSEFRRDEGMFRYIGK